MLPVLKKKMAEWERKRRALPMVSKWLHMQVKRSAYKRARRAATRIGAHARAAAVRKHTAPILAHKRRERAAAAAREAKRRTRVRGGRQRIGGGGASERSAAAAFAEAKAFAEAQETAEVEAEVARLQRERSYDAKMGAARASEAEGDEVEMPELIDPQTLQRMLKDSDYATMETTIEALLLRAQAEARLRERKRIKEITAQVREEAQRKLKYRVGMAMKQIREEVNERVTSEVKAHALQQRATIHQEGSKTVVRVLDPNGGEGGFSTMLTEDELARYREMFAQWDRKGEGVITPEAFSRLMRAVSKKQGKPFSERKVEAMFGLADLDKDGRVDFAEFVVMQEQKRQRALLKEQLSVPLRRGGSGGANSHDGAPPSRQLGKVGSAMAQLHPSSAAVASAAAAAVATPRERIDEVVDLGPVFLREYLKFNPHGDGMVDLRQVCRHPPKPYSNPTPTLLQPYSNPTPTLP